MANSILLPHMWKDGTQMPVEEGTMPVSDTTGDYARGGFDRLRARKGNLFRVQDYLARFRFSCVQLLKAELPFSSSELEQAIRDLLQANDVKDAYICLSFWLGGHAIGLDLPQPAEKRQVRVAIFMHKMEQYYTTTPDVPEGAHVCITNVPRMDDRLIHPGAKVACKYPLADEIRDQYEHFAPTVPKYPFTDYATRSPCGSYLSELRAANVMGIQDNTLFVTHPDTCKLPGFTEDTAKRLAASIGMQVREVRMCPRTFFDLMDESLYGGTAAGLAGIGKVTDPASEWKKTFPVGEGTKTHRLMRFYLEAANDPNFVLPDLPGHLTPLSHLWE